MTRSSVASYDSLPMPLYDYQCAACSAVFEIEHGMAERPKVKCAMCGSTRTSKLFNAAGVQFKGSGFYLTDSRGKDSATRPAADKGGDSSSKPDGGGDKAGSDGVKGESKPTPATPDTASTMAEPAPKTSNDS